MESHVVDDMRLTLWHLGRVSTVAAGLKILLLVTVLLFEDDDTWIIVYYINYVDWNAPYWWQGF